MDLRLMDATATAAEVAAVDALLGPPESGWTGGELSDADMHLAQGGFHAAAARRHLLLPESPRRSVLAHAQHCSTKDPQCRQEFCGRQE